MNATHERPGPDRRAPAHAGTSTPRPRGRLGASTVIGLVLVVIGAGLLLDRADVVDAGQLARDGWPVVGIVLGAVWAVNGSRPVGLVTVALGGLLLLVNFEVLPGRAGAMIGPAVVVVIGTGLVATALSLAQAPSRGGPVPSDVTVGGTSVFGDTRLFLSDEVQGGGDAAVTTTAIFGDVRVEVPAGWRVEDRTTSVFGSVRIPSQQPTYPEAPVVTLYGTAIFGDIRARYLDAMEVE